jgi:anti-sigma factor RsiW
MDCQKCTEDLTAYLDGEIAASRAGQIESHIQGCSTCEAEYKSLKETSDFVTSHLGGIALRQEVWAGIRSRIATADPPSPAWQWRFSPLKGSWRVAAVTSTAALILALGILGYNIYETRQEEAQLRRYMISYVAARDAQELAYGAAADDADSILTDPNRSAASQTVLDRYKYEENPFAVSDTESYSNPFRSEDR